MLFPIKDAEEVCVKKVLRNFLRFAVFPVFAAPALFAQGVTTSSITARVVNESGAPVAGANVTAVHRESGTNYGARTRVDGRTTLPGMRVGGPYRVIAAAIGFRPQTIDSVYLTLGVASDLVFNLKEAAVQLQEIEVTGERDAVFSSERTGAATSVGREALATLPQITGRLESVARLTPQSGGGLSFAGQDSRFNNITVDGSRFNNAFGLGNSPGDRLGVAPISLSALEQVQINIAPYDVRQGTFVGAAVNSVTRSGTNEYSGSVGYDIKNNSLVGTKAGDLDFDPGRFDVGRFTGFVSGPIIKNKLFFHVNYEDEGTTAPGTTWTANAGGETIVGTKTRVLATDLDQLSDFLGSNFGYTVGPYQGYDHETPNKRFLAKLDFNLNDKNKFFVRFNSLTAKSDILLSNSSSLGVVGNRRTNSNALNFQNSNYIQKENIRSVAGEWNSVIGSNMSNSLTVGYTFQDESRESRGDFFPMVDILGAGGTVYTTFGFEPFTPNNELRQKTFNIQNNFSIYGARHTWTFGASAERYQSENVFFPGSQSVYVYSSLQDFYTDANDYLANPNRTTSPVTLRRFQLRFSNIPGQDKPIQPLKVYFAGAYIQDEWQVRSNLKLTGGFRVDVPWFSNTAFQNTVADNLSFRNPDGSLQRYATGELPESKPLFSPRLGFNWDVTGRRRTQLRGGSGVFTGRPVYVWISNQVGNTGVLTGFQQVDNTTTRPFHPDPKHYAPTTVTGAPAATAELALVDQEFKFNQVWRSNLAVDQRLLYGFTGTAEFIYTRDINGISYFNANLPATSARFVGADDRPRWAPAAGSTTPINRIYSNISSAEVMTNQNDGHSWNLAGSVEKAFRGGFFAKAAYSYGVSKNTIDPGSIARGTWTNNAISGDPNNPGVHFSSFSPGHRVFMAATYRKEYFKFGATTISAFWEARTIGNVSYLFSSDMNGDGGTNDLIYIPRDQSEMNFQDYTLAATATLPAVTFTAAEQAAAWDAFIEQDEYMKSRRGQYAERGAVFLPMVKRLDVSLTQDLFANFLGNRNTLQVRMDILNFGNLINSDWGVSQRVINNAQFLAPSPAGGGLAAGVDAQGRARYRFRDFNRALPTSTYERTNNQGDVYQIQFGFRYLFN